MYHKMNLHQTVIEATEASSIIDVENNHLIKLNVSKRVQTLHSYIQCAILYGKQMIDNIRAETQQ